MRFFGGHGTNGLQGVPSFGASSLSWLEAGEKVSLATKWNVASGSSATVDGLVFMVVCVIDMGVTSPWLGGRILRHSDEPFFWMFAV